MYETGRHYQPRHHIGMGDALQWGPLGPGGNPQMSLQVAGVSDALRWAHLGPGGDPRMSLQGGCEGCHLGQGAEAQATTQVSGKLTLPAWGVVAAGVVGIGLGFMFGRMSV